MFRNPHLGNPMELNQQILAAQLKKPRPVPTKRVTPLNVEVYEHKSNPYAKMDWVRVT